MSPVASVIVNVLWLYLLVLIGRLVVDIVRMLARDWQPKGIMLIFAEIIYTLTDPPLLALRKVIPPLRFGGVSLDIAFLVLFIGLQVLIAVVANF
ncbi:MAG TPA: YggT family protein [Actinomycetota bacterium]|nr:YggT family protein [Actinomycetota bacterium]